MYRIYFFNAQGQYQVPVYSELVQSTIEIVFTFKDVVPGIRVTASDEVVFETEQGKVIWPEFEEVALAHLVKAYPPAMKVSALDVLPGYLSAVDRAKSAGPEERSLAFAQLRAAELPLLANAASEGLNLNEYAYRSAELIITELSEVAS